MNFQALYRQLLRDLKASWQKTAILGVLLLVGGAVWTYQIIAVFAGKRDDVEVASPARKDSPAPPTGVQTAELPPQQTAAKSFSWKQFDEVLRTDPLVRSAEVAAIQSHPFQVDHDQFPPPVLFAEEPQQSAAAASQPTTDGNDGLSGLVLKSTIVGVQRRAAYINTKLYFEGSQIQADGRVYRLAAVHPKKVILADGRQTYELKISTSPTTGQFNVGGDGRTESPPSPR